jgi:serine/threonine protein phosphatase 1
MTLIIGDIHRCYDELQALLDKAGIGDDEPIIALGDVMDQGLASPQTLWPTRARQSPGRCSV